MLLTLTPGEMSVAYLMATLRQTVNEAVGVVDRKSSQLPAIQIHQMGAIAEIAFAKRFNCFPDLTVQPRKGGYDAMYQGKRIDIKASLDRNARLVVGVNKDPADIYVLGIVDGSTVDLIGFAKGVDLFQESNLTDFGTGPRYVMNQAQLIRFQGDE